MAPTISVRTSNGTQLSILGTSSSVFGLRADTHSKAINSKMERSAAAIPTGIAML